MTANIFQMYGDIEIKDEAATEDILNLINYLVEEGFDHSAEPDHAYSVSLDETIGYLSTRNQNDELVVRIPILGGGSCSFEEYTTTFFEQMVTAFDNEQLVQNTLMLLKSLTNQNTKLKFSYKEIDLEENTCTDIDIDVTSDSHQPFNINTDVESSKPHAITLRDLEYVEYLNIDDFYEKHEFDEYYKLYHPNKYEYDAWIKSITPKYYNPKTDQFENKDGEILAYNPEDEIFVISD